MTKPLSSVDRPANTMRHAYWLGYGGVIPFGLGALASWLPSPVLAETVAAGIREWVLLYGALILSFMGGTRWGAAIRDWRPDRLIFAVLPALIGWAVVIPQALLGDLSFAYTGRALILMGAFFLLLASELMTSNEWSPWYKSLRTRLTFGVTGFLLLSVLGTTQ